MLSLPMKMLILGTLILVLCVQYLQDKYVLPYSHNMHIYRLFLQLGVVLFRCVGIFLVYFY